MTCKILPSPVKSAGDDREYRSIELENGMQCILIHDAEADKAAASMDVHVGYFSDPKELPGLAHFCEHMLFLGTKKYPDENSYNVFLSANGGSSNAYTSNENTNYYFDVKHEELEGALDMFAQFFIDPLFTEAATDREMQAVNNENSNNLLNDYWRMDQLLKSTSNPDHVFSKYGTGNIDTLQTIPKEKGIDVRGALLEFHKKYYSSNISKLAVSGRESLDELQKMVVEKFAAVRNLKREVPKFDVDALGNSSLRKVYKIVPVKDIRWLVIIWPLPESKSKYLQKPSSVISHLLGHESAGSVLQLLKEKGWANGLCAGSSNSCTSFSTFSCQLDLTQEGLNHTDEIVTIVFQYLEMLKGARDEEWEMILQEVMDVDNMNFRFKSKENPSSFVSSVSSAMQYLQPVDFLQGNYLIQIKDINLVKQYVDLLSKPNCRIHIVDQSLEGECDKSEEWYTTKYSEATFSDELTKMIENSPRNENLFLPEKNEFIATDFELKFKEGTKSTKYPILLENVACKTWWKCDDTFKKPKANCVILIDTPESYKSSPSAAVSMELFLRLLTDSLASYSYMADIAGLSYDLSSSSTGVQLWFQGYSDKLKVLLEKVLQKMKVFGSNVEKDRFELLKEEMERDLANFDKEQPYTHAMFFSQLCTEAVWSNAERQEALKNLTMEDLSEYITVFFREGGNVELLVHGNMSEEDAREISAIVKDTLQLKPLSPSRIPDRRVVQLKEGIQYKLTTPAKNAAEKNSAVCFQLQVGTDAVDTEKAAYTNLLTHLLKEPTFNTLRTKEQLGYLVWTGASNSLGVICMQIIVQSGDHGAAYLHSRTETFIQTTFKDLLEEMDEEAFNKNKEAVIALKLEKDKTLHQETSRFFREISNRRYQFDRVATEVSVLESITKTSLQKFFEEHVKTPESRKLLTVQVEGHNETTSVADEVTGPVEIMSSEECSNFRAKMPLYPNVYSMS